MRNKAEFRAYVYEKAEAQGKLRKKKRAVFARTAVAFSLCLIVSGVWLYAEWAGGNQTAADAGAENEFAPMPVAIVEAEKAEEALDVVRGMDDLENAQSYKYTTNEETATACGSSSVILYSTMLDSVTLETQLPYTIARSADEYNGECADINFNTHVAVVFEGMHILSHKVAYSQEAVTVALTTGNGEAALYTVLIEKTLLNDLPIQVVYP